MVKHKQNQADEISIPRIGRKKKTRSLSTSSSLSNNSKEAIKQLGSKLVKNKTVKKTKKNLKVKKKSKSKNNSIDNKNSDKEELGDKVNESVDEDNEDKDSDINESSNSKENEKLIDDIDLEYSKLQTPTNPITRKENLCSMCEMPNSLIECKGPCQQFFHLDCIGLLTEPKEPFKCEECLNDSHPCFLCKKPSSKENNMITKKCSSSSCGKYYHDECAKKHNLFRKDSSGSSKTSSYICSLHSCNTCFVEANSDGSNISSSQAHKGRFVRCVRCPVAYHIGEHCLAAGSVILNSNFLICPAHLQTIKSQPRLSRVNVNWCFVCCKVGDLIGCNQCPAAYHTKCLHDPETISENDSDSEKSLNLKKLEPSSPKLNDQNSPVSQLSPESTHSSSTAVSANTLNSAKSFSIQSNWTCEDCLMGKRPLYGEIVWAKVGNYRWWPAQICLPRCLPENLRERPFQVGEFPVKFFGTNDYYWLTNGRCFKFAEGDESHNTNSTIRKSLGLAFKEGVEEAKIAFKEVEKLKSTRYNKTNNTKYNFHFIKTNKPVGNVVVNKLRLDELSRCECDPKSAAPCSSDKTCINRMLNHECHPSICPAGENCHNQRFVKRQYPKQEAFPTGSRGWGLRSLIDIKKGDFVNEYVGELINDEECKRRLDLSHKNDIRNFYFLAIEKDRIIDAGPKGNLARFANHSCEPNMETQKWVVNGDIRIGLFALVDIPAFTELTFNYNLDCLSNEKAICKCGAKNCSGFIGERPKNGNDAKSSKSNTSIKSDSTNSNQSTSTNTKKRKMSETPKNVRVSIEEPKAVKITKKRTMSLAPNDLKNIKLPSPNELKQLKVLSNRKNK